MVVSCHAKVLLVYGVKDMAKQFHNTNDTNIPLNNFSLDLKWTEENKN